MTGTSSDEGKTDVGIVSLGMSCQTTHQLRLHQPALCDLGIGPDSIPSGYFDWLICPPESAAMLIEDGMPGFKPGESQ